MTHLNAFFVVEPGMLAYPAGGIWNCPEYKLSQLLQNNAKESRRYGSCHPELHRQMRNGIWQLLPKETNRAQNQNHDKPNRSGHHSRTTSTFVLRHHGRRSCAYGRQHPSSPYKHRKRMPSTKKYHPYGLTRILTGLESSRNMWDMRDRLLVVLQPPPTCLPKFRRALLFEWCNIPQYQKRLEVSGYRAKDKLQVKGLIKREQFMIQLNSFWSQTLRDEVEKLAYQLNEEAERTERPITRLSKMMYGSTCADMQVHVMGKCLSSIKHVVGVRSVFLAKRLHAV
ncbi:uncharacterized protein TNCV_235491 [Trichonephila clavipes]|uniref:Uncharacterized protein n=1 Tax=Trichonephila clavipes TaxID=2585209 RepID=A0A8X6SJP6_TRICX|nr:uncharacterized protein TNCV_235491 [Trichonephila clavipes]